MPQKFQFNQITTFEIAALFHHYIPKEPSSFKTTVEFFY